jgi:hypothetical protein
MREDELEFGEASAEYRATVALDVLFKQFKGLLPDIESLSIHVSDDSAYQAVFVYRSYDRDIFVNNLGDAIIEILKRKAKRDILFRRFR